MKAKQKPKRKDSAQRIRGVLVLFRDRPRLAVNEPAELSIVYFTDGPFVGRTRKLRHPIRVLPGDELDYTIVTKRLRYLYHCRMVAGMTAICFFVQSLTASEWKKRRLGCKVENVTTKGAK